MDGTIKRKVEEKGFGFILGSDGGERFFHHSAVKNRGWDAVREGDQVTFDPVKHQKGDRAENVYVGR